MTLTPGAVRHPQVTLPAADLIGAPTYLISSRVTRAMWAAGVADEDIHAYCAAIAGTSPTQAVQITRSWVVLTSPAA